MHRYIARRLLTTIPTLIGIKLVVFASIRLVPGDVILTQLADTGNVSPEQYDAVRQKLGLDKPAYQQYFTWLGGIVRGDLGESFWTGRSVRAQLLERLPVTIQLGLMALLMSLTISIPLGTIAATRQDTIVDYPLRMVAIIGLAMPSFWVGILLLLAVGTWFQWSPPLGYTSIVEDPWRSLQQFALPALALGAALIGTMTRMTRSVLLEVLRQDYVRTAWAKGLTERVVIVRHALKNAMIPLVTILGLQVGYLLGGTVIIEQVFALPGVGRLTLDALLQRDYPQIQGNVMFIAGWFLLVNLIVDLTYGWLDPRIRYN